MLSPGRHYGFHVFFGNRIWPKDEMPMENLEISISQPSSQDPQDPYGTGGFFSDFGDIYVTK
jgi:hypothetical protein